MAKAPDAGSTDIARYLVSAIMFPALATWLAARWALSALLPKSWCLALMPSRSFCLRRWNAFKTANTAGVFLQVGFVPMMAVSLKPFMCYKHPNGLRSIVSFPNIFCGDGGQSTMMVIGLVSWSRKVCGAHRHEASDCVKSRK